MKRILSALIGVLLLTLCLCPAIAEVSLPQGLSVISDQAFEGNTEFSGVIELPSGVRVVGNQAFKNTNVFGLKLPAAVRSVGDGILESSGTTYAIVGSASPVLASGAFSDVDVLVGRPGGTVERWAFQHDVSFYDMTMLCYSGGFAYLYELDGSVTLAFPVKEHTGAVRIPANVDGRMVTHVSANAFTNLTGVTAISLPDTVEGMPDVTIGWPENAEISSYAVRPKPVLPEENESSPHRVTRVTMSPSQVALNQGDKVQLEMLDAPVSSWRRICTWVSSDESVATVDRDGWVTAVGEGQASITATVRVASLNEVATPGEPVPMLTYYGVTNVTVEPGDLAVHVFDNALSLSVGQGFYPSYNILHPSDLEYPEVSFGYADSLGRTQDDETPVVRIRKIGDGALYVEGCASGTATVTVTARYGDRTAEDRISIKVTEPKVNFPSLMTYVGYQYDLSVAALPEGATVAWASDDTSVASVGEDGHVRINSVGETAITCTITDAEGKTQETAIPVSVKLGFIWTESPDQRELIAGWEYHAGFEDIAPAYVADLWPHDGTKVSMTMESSDKDVLDFVEYDGRPVARAGQPGEANVTYTCTVNYPQAEGATPPTINTFVRSIKVGIELSAHLEENEIFMAAGEAFNIECWYESNTDVSRQWIYSTDPSVFTVTAQRRMTAHGAGEAELVYGVEAYGTTSEVRAKVYVTGWEIEMEPKELTLEVGQSASILARMTMPEGVEGETNHNASHYTSNNEEIACVDELGLVTAVGAGTTVIDYETFVRVPGEQEDEDDHYMRVRAYCSVTVTDPNADPNKAITFRTAEGVEPVNGVLHVYPNVTTELQAYDSQGNRLENVTWECLSIDGWDWADLFEDGWLFPHGPNGDKAERRYVRATATIGGEEVSALLTIDIDEPPARFEYCYLEGDVLQVGETRPVTIGMIYPTTSDEKPDVTVKLIPWDKSIVNITEDNRVEALAPGLTNVQVELFDSNGVCCERGYFTVRVERDRPEPGEGVTIEFDQKSFYLALENGPDDACADVMITSPESDVDLRDFYPITYVSGDPEIVRIDEDGYITHNGVAGTANIYAYIGDFIGKDDPVAVAQVTVGKPEVTMTIRHADGSDAQTMVNGGEADLTVGDGIEIEVIGLPDSEQGVDVQTDVNYNNWTLYLNEQSDTGDFMRLTAINAEDNTDVYVNIGIGEGWWQDYGFFLHVREKEKQEGEYRFDCGSFITLALDEEWALWPEFDWREVKDVRSSDENVVQVSSTEETPIAVRGVGLGRSTVTASFLPDDSETWVPVSCEILVVENPWELRGLGELPQIMIAGEWYWGYLDVFHLSRSRPETIIVSSDPEGLAAKRDQDNRDGWMLHALKAGQYTLTLTATGPDDETQTLEVPVTVVQPQVLTSPRQVDCRPGASQMIRLIVAEKVNVQSVTWTSDNTRIAGVQSVKDDATSALITIAPDAVPGNRALITAEVALEDGSVLTASCWAQIIGDHDVWINVWFDQGNYRKIRMGDEEWLDVWVDSNAEISNQYYASSDESIVAVSARGRLTARKPGVAQITYTAESYGRTGSATATVRVLGPEASLNKTAMTLSRGESEYLVPTFEEGAQVDADSIEYVSYNESVARVDHRGLVTAVGAGTTTVRLRANVDDTPVLLVCTVTVPEDAPKLQITLNGEPVTRVTLQPRQELQFAVAAAGEMTGSAQWSASDPDWMEIEDGRLIHWGMETAADLGTAYISASAVVDGVTETAYCEIDFQPPQVTIGWSPDYYEVGVGDTCTFEYVINTTDPKLVIVPEFVSEDEDVATIEGYPAYEDGAGRVAAVITGKSRGVCLVHLNLRDAQGRLLTTGGAYVYVDTPLPTPADEGMAIAFSQEAYYLPVPEGEDEVWCHAGVENADYLQIFGNTVCYESENPNVVRIDEDGNMQAIGEGTTTIHAWFDGYTEEQHPHASATVTVGRGLLKVTINGEPAKRGWDNDAVNDVKPGDTVSIEMEDMPEGVRRHWANWDFDGNFFHVRSESESRLELVVRGDWESNVRMRTELAPEGHYFEDGVRFRSAKTPAFDMTYVRANPGEEIELWPTFEWSEILDVQSSNPEAVEILESEFCPVYFAAKDVGKALITAQVKRYNSDEVVEIFCRVEVVEASWRLRDLDGIDSVMQVGQLYNRQPNVEFSGFYGPMVSWDYDPAYLTMHREGYDTYLKPVKTGVTTLTVTVGEGEEAQSLDKTITITEPKVYFEQSCVELRRGASLTVPLLVNVPMDDITEITISSMNGDMAGAELVTLEESRAPAARITGLGEGGNTRVIAHVSMKDGSVLAAACEVHLISNEEIWVETDGYNIELSNAEYGSCPQSSDVWLNWNHNAYLDGTGEDPNADKAWIEWWIDDEDVARIDGFAKDEDGHTSPWNNGVILVSVAENGGETTLHAKVTLRDKDDNILAESETYFPIVVHQARVELIAPNDGNPVEMLVGEQRYLGWGTDLYRTKMVQRTQQTVADPTIADYDVHGNVTALKPGTTELQYTLVLAGGKTFNGSLPITVAGPEIALAQKEYTVSVGESVDLGLMVDSGDWGLYEEHWENSNPNVAMILNDSYICGLAPGEAQISYYVRLNDETDYRASALVTVTGEPSGFALSESALVLFAEERAQLTAEGVENAVWTSSDERVATVTENGKVIAGRFQDMDTRIDATAIITCTGTKDGQPVSASCHVTVRCPKVRIAEHQFGDGRWEGMNLGDEMNIWEQFVVCDSSVTATRTITVDDPAVIEYDAERNVLRAVGEGHTFVHYMVTSSEGEIHTRDLLIRVNEDCTPESITPEFGTFIVPFQWNQHYLPLRVEPEYTGIHLECTSSDESIVSFDDGPGSTEMYFHGKSGLVTIEVNCPENEEFSTQTQVLVVDQDNLPFFLAAEGVTDEDGRTVLSPGQTVQLALRNLDGLDLSGEITIHYPTEYDTNRISITQDGWFTVQQDRSEESCTFDAEIEMGHGWWMPVRFTYSVNAESEPYFFLRQDGGAPSFTLAPGSGTCLDVISNQTYEQEELVFSSSDAAVATVEWGQNEHAGRLLVIGQSAGEATITATLNGMTSTYPITVVVPTEIQMGMDISLDRNVVLVGEEFEVYTGFEKDWDDSFANFDRRHEYTSSNPAVLQRLDILDGEDPDGRHWMTMRALTPGQATITSEAWLENYPDVRDVDTMTITVIQLKLYFEQSYVELRPGASLTVPLHVTVPHDEVAEITVSSEHADLATAELVTLENGDLAAKITGVGTEGDTRVIAHVSMTDGSVLDAACDVHLISNEEVWVNAHGYDIELSTEDWGGAPHRDVVWQLWDHNASHFDEPDHGEGTDTAWIEWTIEDESIAKLDGTYFEIEEGKYAPWNNGPMIVGLKEGKTTIHTRLVLKDADGGILAEDTAEFPVNVTAPRVELIAPNDGNPVEMLVGEQRFLGWNAQRENTTDIVSDCQTVADPSIAAYDMHGNVTALRPGETELVYSVTFVGGHIETATLPLTVTGPTISLAQKAYTVGVGETFNPGLTVADNGYEPVDQHWENSNPEAVAILNDSTIYGAAPGQALIMYYARLNDDVEIRRTAMVTVTGEPEGFALSESALVLFAEERAQLTAEGVENAVWTSSDERVATVTQSGKVIAGRFQDMDTRIDATAIITCTGTKDGEAVSASCHVTVRCPKVRIAEHQFGDGRWEGMSLGDEMNIWEQFVVCDSSVTATRTITVDDPAIIEYDAERNVLRAVGEGHTFVHYMVTSSEGEIHTRDLLIRVNEDCTPESITPEFGTFIVPFQWNQHYLPLRVEPEYTGIHLECTSSDESIVSFDDGPGSTEMYFHGKSGLVTIDVSCPERPELSTQAKVLVVDEDNLPFTLEATNGETVLTPGQTVELVVRNSAGVDLGDDLSFYLNDEPDMSGVRYEGNHLTVTASESSPDNGAWAHVELRSGWSFDLCYAYSVDAESEPYFFLRQDGEAPSFTLAPGSGTCLDVISNQTYEQEELVFSSSDAAVATVEWGQNEHAGRLLVIGQSAGEATITATLRGMTASYPITVVVPTEIQMGMDISLDRNVVLVGEEFEVYTGFEKDWDDSFANFDRRHEYTSSNPAVLERLDILEGEDPDGCHWMTMRALAPGQATITSEAWLENYPDVRDVDTMTITVIPAE